MTGAANRRKRDRLGCPGFMLTTSFPLDGRPAALPCYRTGHAEFYQSSRKKPLSCHAAAFVWCPPCADTSYGGEAPVPASSHKTPFTSLTVILGGGPWLSHTRLRFEAA
jgi:hypothetical protein